MKKFIELPKLSSGDQVAVISPSSGIAGLFPWVQDLGLERMKNVFKLNPVEYPTTRQMGSSLQDRARDVMDAFANPKNKAVFTSIGGKDQIRLIKYLDKNVFINNPKPFFGFSDNTHLHNFLWNLGIPSYYGGAIMTQFAMQGEMHNITVEFLKHALFDEGEFELRSSDLYNDEELNWSEKENLNKTRRMEKNSGWYWDGTKDSEGILWGGCVESLIVQSSTNKYLPSEQDLDGTILFLETSEGIPDQWVIEYLLMGMGEKGWLNKFGAVLVGRPKAWEFGKEKTVAEKVKYSEEQRDTVLKTIRMYNQDIPVIQNLDFGHTDPQIVLPCGGRIKVISSKQQIIATY